MERPFGMVSVMDPRNRELDKRAHWRHLANTVEQLFAAAMSESHTRRCGLVMCIGW